MEEEVEEAAIPWAMYLPELQCVIREHADCLARAHLAMTCREEHEIRTTKFTTTLSGSRSTYTYLLNGIVVHGSDAMLRHAFEDSHDHLLYLFKMAIPVGRETIALEWLGRAAPKNIRRELRHDSKLLHEFTTRQSATTFIDIVAEAVAADEEDKEKEKAIVVERMMSPLRLYWDAIEDTTKEKLFVLLVSQRGWLHVRYESLLKWCVDHAEVDVLGMLPDLDVLLVLEPGPSLSLLNALLALGCRLRRHGSVLPRWPLLHTQWIVQHVCTKITPRLDWHNPDITVVGWLATHFKIDLAQDWHEILNERGFDSMAILALSSVVHWIRLIRHYALRWPVCLLRMAIHDCDIGAIRWLLDHTERIMEQKRRNHHIGAFFANAYAIRWLLENKRLRLDDTMKSAWFIDTANDRLMPFCVTLV